MALSHILGGRVDCFPSLKTYSHERYGNGSGIAFFWSYLDFPFDARLKIYRVSRAFADDAGIEWCRQAVALGSQHSHSRAATTLSGLFDISSKNKSDEENSPMWLICQDIRLRSYCLAGQKPVPRRTPCPPFWVFSRGSSPPPTNLKVVEARGCYPDLLIEWWDRVEKKKLNKSEVEHGRV